VTGKKTIRALEFVLFFFGLPLYIFFEPELIHPSIFILPGLILVFIYLGREKQFRFAELWHWRLGWAEWRKQLGLVALSGLLMFLAVYFFEPENLFNLPRKNLRVWLVFSLFYPLISATGQEIIYRAFIRYRYRLIFPGKKAYLLASGITFSFVHIVYYSPVSLVLTLAMGLYLAYLYWRTQSILLSAVLHGLWGNLAFGLGLGHYFWLDINQYLNQA